MDDSRFFCLCLVCSVSGLLGLFFFTSHVTGMVVSVGEIGFDMEGVCVKVCGSVVKHYVSKDGHVFMDVKDSTGTIDVVVFEGEVHNIMGISPLELKGGDSICARGEVEVYRGAVEILPREITYV